MHRLTLVLVFSLSPVFFWGQAISQPAPTSDAQAVSLAQQAIAALTGGASINDVTLNASVTSIYDNNTGAGLFQAKGSGESRVSLNSSSGTRSDARTSWNGLPGGAWQLNGAASVSYPQHNCWTDAVWFFPPLSSLTQTANPNYVFQYLGQAQLSGLLVQHIRAFQAGIGTQLSAVDFYIDSTSRLPVAMTFNSHPDNDVNQSMFVEVGFANYQAINGIRVPMHVQRMLNGNVVLNIIVTSISFNTGLNDSLFALQ